jgi:hypothetical protein
MQATSVSGDAGMGKNFIKINVARAQKVSFARLGR